MNSFLSYDNLLMFVALFVLIMSGGYLLFNAFWRFRQDQDLQRRLEGGNSFADTLRKEFEAENKANFLETIGNHLSLPGTEEITKVRFNLSLAGYYHPGSVKIFYAIRMLAILFPIIGVLIYWQFFAVDENSSKIITIGAILGLVGFLGPDYFLKYRKSKRTYLARQGFPDMMDLLVACIEAGLGMDAAFIRVTKEIGNRYPPLKVNLELMNLELRAGRSRHEALNTFAKRINLEEASSMAILIKQAEEMGSSLGSTLRRFSIEMREKRMLRAEEKAAGLSAKLTVPMMFFIFPVLFIVLITPAAIKVMESLST